MILSSVFAFPRPCYRIFNPAEKIHKGGDTIPTICEYLLGIDFYLFTKLLRRGQWPYFFFNPGLRRTSLPGAIKKLDPVRIGSGTFNKISF
jgi:hypothetical protein